MTEHTDNLDPFAAGGRSADELPALVDEYFRYYTLNTKESEAALDEHTTLGDRIAESVAGDAAGILAQLRLVHDLVDNAWADEDRHHRLVASIEAGVARLGGAA